MAVECGIDVAESGMTDPRAGGGAGGPGLRAASAAVLVPVALGAAYLGGPVFIAAVGAAGVLAWLEWRRLLGRPAVDVAGATLLHIHLHRFGDGGGVTGVAVLAESHITVHTWPERGFAAFDVFMCGRCRPELAAEVIRGALEPERAEISVERRGVVG